MATINNNFLDYNSYIDTNNYSCFIRTLEESIENHLKKRINQIQGGSNKYAVNIRFERDYNSLHPKFFYLLTIRETTRNDGWIEITNNDFFCVTIETKKIYMPDVVITDLIDEFRDLCLYLPEKILLMKYLKQKHNIDISNYFGCMETLIEGENKIKYKMQKTEEYKKPKYSKNNEDQIKKEFIIDLLFDSDWMTIDEIETMVELAK